MQEGGGLQVVSTWLSSCASGDLCTSPTQTAQVPLQVRHRLASLSCVRDSGQVFSNSPCIPESIQYRERAAASQVSLEPPPLAGSLKTCLLEMSWHSE